MAGNRLVELGKLGQSPWYDQMTRSLVTQGTLQKMIEEDGLRGLTSNPTIFEKAISGSKDYEDALRDLVSKGAGVDEIYDALVVTDIASAADVFRPVYDRTQGEDGFVSIEVSPLLARDTAGTIQEAKRLHAKLARPNVLVKVPATPEGLPAIEELISEGVSVNITLIFSVPVYAQVVEAYLKGWPRPRSLTQSWRTKSSCNCSADRAGKSLPPRERACSARFGPPPARRIRNIPTCCTSIRSSGRTR